jgi:hypothetical protein
VFIKITSFERRADPLLRAIRTVFKIQISELITLNGGD